ncbi:MAG TPA: gliding motility-associated C-terminal domain-containing protein, partial [Aquaticitalea sp.]|nr:gliding motility-associated C-terminal domain-containing protein [Aquaticitalea sp.]
GDTISFYINSDGSVSCQQTGTYTPIDVTVACATCINPAATYAVIDDCENGEQFLIEVNITSIGDAQSVTVTDNQASPGQQVTETGVVQMGPYPFATPIVITISNDQDVNCSISSPSIQVAACPPANDNPCGATVAIVNNSTMCDQTTSGTILAATPSGVPNGSCVGNPDDDVWFQFTALDETQVISLLNITGGTTNLDHALYSGSCGTLTEMYCSGDSSAVTPILTVGDTYFIRVFSAGSAPETSNFELCIQSAPNNIACEDAANFCSDGSGSNIVGFPDNTQVACLGSIPNPAWNIIQIGDPGLVQIEISQYSNTGQGLDVDFVLWGPFDINFDYCSLDLLVDCPSCPNNTWNPDFYPFGNIVDCSYDPAYIEHLTIHNAQSGEIYLLLVTNYSNSPGTITITQTNQGQTGAGSTVAEIQVDLGGDQQLCGYTSYEITANSPFADAYEWYQDGFIIDNATSSTLTVTESGVYSVFVYDQQCGSTATDEVTITLVPEPVANAVSDIVTCDDASGDGVGEFNLDAQTPLVLGGQDPSLFNVSYHLTQIDANTDSNPLASPYTNISNPQTIYVRVEAVGGEFCIATTNFQLVISGPTPTVTHVDYSVCDESISGGTASFDLESQTELVIGTQDPEEFTVTYHLTEEEANSGTGMLASPYTNTSNPQTIWVRIESNVSSTCFGVGNITLNVGELPVTTLTSGTGRFEICNNATRPLTITASGNYTSSDVSVVWYHDGGVMNGENGLSISVLDGGLYEVEVTFNETGCTSTVGQQVVVLENCIIPQGISPNGDGKNDTFDLSGFNVTKIEIYNRYGTLVYSKDNYTDEWHGQSNNGDELPVGTYFYTIVYEGGAKTKSAWVYLNK